MNNYNLFSFVLCLIVCSGFGAKEKYLKREKRQIFYEDVMNLPKVFRSRADEKEQIPIRAESEINEDIKPSLDPELLANLLADLDTNAPPKGSPFKVPNSFQGVVKHKPRPKPTYEEPFPLKPVFEKVIRHKPKPAYEEPYILKPFTQVSSRASSSYKRPFTVQAPSNLEEPFQKPYNHGVLENHFPAGQNYESPSRQQRPRKEKHTNTIPGVPGKDYPVYNEVPHTSFACDQVPFKPGMYANPETGCQAYHVCHDNRHGPQGASFLCTNGTIFNQETFNCDWWFNVDCNQAVSSYGLNSDLNFNPYFKKPAEIVQYKSESLPEIHRPKLNSNLLLESQISSTFSKASLPEIPTFPNFKFFSSENGHSNPASFSTPKRAPAPVASDLPGEIKTTAKVEKTATFSFPKTAQAFLNPFSNDAGRSTTKSERTVSPNSSQQSFEINEKLQKSHEFVRTFEDSSESTNIKKESAGLSPPPSTRRVLRRRKRPRPSASIPTTASESLSQSSIKLKNANNNKPNSETSELDIPEDAILDFEWGQRTT